MNNIICKEDCTKHLEAKMSPCLKRVAQSFAWKDSYRFLHPDGTCFSRYYSNDRHGAGATRIDRSYCYGDLVPADADYVSVAFSDHLSYIVTLKAPPHLQKLICPKYRPFLRIHLLL